MEAMKEIKISVPTEVLRAVQKHIENSEFNSLSEYITFVLREIVSDEIEEAQALTKEDEEKVKQRLKELGYLE